MRAFHQLFLLAIAPTLGCCGLHHVGVSCMGGHEHGAQAAPATQAPQPGSTTPPSATTKYSCSMHPEVQATFPGTCPVCGMTLAKE